VYLGCEEFYYSNAPSNYAASLGVCGNGVYREIQVFIDGILAAATYPFPVIYSGGVNPFLWRPLAGTMSFSISPRRLDVTPFLHLLSDGDTHEVSVTVYGNNADEGGYWFLDVALLTTYSSLSTAASYNPVSTKLTVYDSGVNQDLSVGVSKSSDGVVTASFNTTGSHSFNASREIIYEDGSVVIKSTIGDLVMYNDNAYIGELLMIRIITRY